MMELSYIKEGKRFYNWHRISQQDELWIDWWGRSHVIDAMDPDYAWNALKFFIRNHAQRLWGVELLIELTWLSTVAAMEREDQHGFEEFDSIPDDPEDWAWTLPLVKALGRRAEAMFTGIEVVI